MNEISKVGEINVAKNGMSMEIIAYRDNNDIDVKFEDGTIVKGKTYLSFKRGTISLPTEKKTQVSIMLDKDAKDLLDSYSKTIGKNASEVINNLIKLNCTDFDKYNDSIFGTYGNNVSYLKNFDYKFLSKMSKEEFIGRYVNSVLGEMKNSIYHCITPKCKNVDHDMARILYFRPHNGYIRYIEDTTTMLLDLFDASIKTFEDIVISMFGKDSDEYYIVKIYNKYLNESGNDDAECWKFENMYDYGVYIDDYTKKTPNGNYFTRIGSILNILHYQGREKEIDQQKLKSQEDFLKSIDNI